MLYCSIAIPLNLCPCLYGGWLKWCWISQVGFTGSSSNNETACNVRDLSLIRGSGRSPGEGNGNPLQYFCLGKSHGQRSLARYSPWDHKELGMTKWLTHTHTSCQARLILFPSVPSQIHNSNHCYWLSNNNTVFKLVSSPLIIFYLI